jgi:hypothetical protein
MSDLDFEKYPFLLELGVKAENCGCYTGKEWKASGSISPSYSPNN